MIYPGNFVFSGYIGLVIKAWFRLCETLNPHFPSKKGS